MAYVNDQLGSSSPGVDVASGCVVAGLSPEKKRKIGKRGWPMHDGEHLLNCSWRFLVFSIKARPRKVQCCLLASRDLRNASSSSYSPL